MSTVFAAPGNNVSTTVGSAYTAGDYVSTGMVLATGAHTKFPTLSGGQYYRITVCQVAFAYSPTATTANYTIYKATGFDGTNVDKLVGMSLLEGTSDRGYAVGDIVEIRVTAGTLGDIQTAVNSIETGTTFLPLVKNSAVLGSNYAITADGNFHNTGFSIALPAAGTYLVDYNVRVVMTTNSGGDGFIAIYLYQSDQSIVVPNSNRLCFYMPTALGGDTFQVHSAYSAAVTVNAACNIQLWAKAAGSAGFSLSSIYSNSDGYTTLSYLRVS